MKVASFRVSTFLMSASIFSFSVTGFSAAGRARGPAVAAASSNVAENMPDALMAAAAQYWMARSLTLHQLITQQAPNLVESLVGKQAGPVAPCKESLRRLVKPLPRGTNLRILCASCGAGVGILLLGAKRVLAQVALRRLAHPLPAVIVAVEQFVTVPHLRCPKLRVDRVRRQSMRRERRHALEHRDECFGLFENVGDGLQSFAPGAVRPRVLLAAAAGEA